MSFPVLPVCSLFFNNAPNLLMACSKAVPIPLNSSTHFCLFRNLPTTTTLWLLPFMSFEIFLFVLAALECSRHIRNLIGTGQWTQHAVVTVIFRDSLVYFFLCIATWQCLFALLNPLLCNAVPC